MKKAIAIIVGCAALISLSGCTKNCEDCDDCADQPYRHADHSAITHCNECVPAPAPMASAPAEASEKPVTAESQARPPVPVPAPTMPERPARVVEVRRVQAAPPPRNRRVLSGEIEIDDL